MPKTKNYRIFLEIDKNQLGVSSRAHHDGRSHAFPSFDNLTRDDD